MGKINQLTPFIYNRIAAGEVVERPASVVKELVENALDAGATAVDITVEEGGIRRIVVADNGNGIEREDLSLAFLPHATSKIKAVDDLDAIATLGFRGEALASIAAVARVTVVSKTEQAEEAYSLTVTGGKMEEVISDAANKGTRFTVENLFFNAPARLKFLKTPRTEEAEITDTVSRFILTNPSVSFRYFIGTKRVYDHAGGGLSDAIRTVYGAATAESILPLNYNSADFSITGYIGATKIAKSNRTYQTVSVNGRYVSSAAFSGTVQNAYADYLMRRQYPFFVLNVSIPLTEVDVNVHPNKKEVRFRNPNVVLGALYKSVQRVLSMEAYGGLWQEPAPPVQPASAAKLAPAREKVAEELPAAKPAVRPVTPDMLVVREKPNVPYSVKKAEEEAAAEKLKRQIVAEMAVPLAQKAKDELLVKSTFKKTEIIPPVLPEGKEPTSAFIAEEKVGGITESADKPVKQEPIAKAPVSAIEAWGVVVQAVIPEAKKAPIRLVGQLFSTYLLVESGDDAFLIDQHAAHERLLYDRFLEECNKSEVGSQALLIPFVYPLNAREREELNAHIGEFRAMGFVIEPLASSWKISAVPFLLEGIDLKSFLDRVLSDVFDGKSIRRGIVLKEELAMRACKAAVKGGQTLSTKEAELLIERINEGMELLCPHGRPILLRFHKRDLEKGFKRVL